jgi:hypothetical protein
VEIEDSSCLPSSLALCPLHTSPLIKHIQSHLAASFPDDLHCYPISHRICSIRKNLLFSVCLFFSCSITQSRLLTCSFHRTLNLHMTADFCPPFHSHICTSLPQAQLWLLLRRLIQ